MPRVRPLLTMIAMALALALPARGQLAGLYTINPAAPASGGNFTSLQDAVVALMSQGVAAPVVFELFDNAGPFHDTMPFSTSNVTWDTNDAVLTLGTWPGAAPERRVTFRPAAGHRPVLDATGRAMGIFWNGADYVTVEGLEVRGATFDAVSIYSEAQHGQVLDAVIRRCRLHDCGGSGVVVYGNLPAPQNTRIENNFFWSLQTTNAGGFNTLARFGYVSARRTNGTVIVNNTFYADTAAGQGFAVIGSQPGSLTDMPFAQLADNIIVKAASPGHPILYFPTIGGVSSTPLFADGNCYHDVSSGLFAAAGTNGQTFIQDLAGWRTATGLDASSFEADPLLTSPGTGDLHLLAGSPCKDAAVLGAVTDDIDGQARGGEPDIGADEVGHPVGPRAVMTGTSVPHPSGPVPVLSTNQLPALGNTSFPVTVSGALPFSQVWFFGALGLAPAPIPFGAGANRLYLDPVTMLQLHLQGISPAGPFPAGAAGSATLTLAIGNDPALAGFELVIQAAVSDAQAPDGFVTTNALDLVIN